MKRKFGSEVFAKNREEEGDGSMIPKIIHYCWVGGNPYPDSIKSCMESWHEHLDDYAFMRWDEETFDVNSNQYVKEAYQAKKWAFVSDYVRLWALYNYGGIYLDSDVRVFKSLDRFLEHGFFSGYENRKDIRFISTGTMGGKKGNSFIKALLDDYDDRVFIKKDGTLDLTTNVVSITKKAKELYGFVGNGEYQILGDDTHIYPYDFFSGYTGEGKCGDKDCYNITDNTYTIHEFAGSWVSNVEREGNFFIRKITKNGIKKTKVLGITVKKEIVKSWETD